MKNKKDTNEYHGGRIKPLVEGVAKLVAKDPTLADFAKGRVRRLTPVECERLQSLPDNFTSQGREGEKIIEVSDAQRYKAAGNAFNTDVVAHILSFIPRAK